MTHDELTKRAANVALAIQASGWEQAHRDFLAILAELPATLRNPLKNQRIAQTIIDEVCKTT
jgi:hypothetical protein